MRPKRVMAEIKKAGVPVLNYREAYPGHPGEIELPRGVHVRFYGCVIYNVFAIAFGDYPRVSVPAEAHDNKEDAVVREALRLFNARGEPTGVLTRERVDRIVENAFDAAVKEVLDGLGELAGDYASLYWSGDSGYNEEAATFRRLMRRFAVWHAEQNELPLEDGLVLDEVV